MSDDTCSSLATCCELIHELAAISDQWIELGIHLNIPVPTIKKIECDTIRLERRQAKLFQYWVKHETNPTWQKVVDALETIGEVQLASKLTEKHKLKATVVKSVLVQTENGASNPSEDFVGNVVVKVTDKSDIARKLNDIENEFVELESGILGAIIEMAFPLSRLRLVADSMLVSREDFSKCSNLYDIFKVLKQYYSFLNIKKLEKLNSIVLSGLKSTEISQYIERLEEFKSSCTIKDFMDDISAKAKQVTLNGKFQIVTLQLVEWEEMTMHNLEQLLHYLFKNNADLFNHIRIEPGSVHVSWLVPSVIVPDVHSQAKEKTVFLHQMGVQKVEVGEHTIFTYQDGVSVQMDSTVFNFPSLLLNATEDGCTEILDFLLHSSVDVNYSDHEGWSALLVASKCKKLDIAELLLCRKANVNHKNNDGDTAIIMASEIGHVAMVKLCLEHGANPNIENENQSTSLVLTIVNFHHECTHAILQVNVDINHANSSGITALITASQLGNIEAVRMLLNSHADPSIQDCSGASALTKACELGNEDIVHLLLKAGANQAEFDETMHKAVPIACAGGHYNVVSLLLEAKVDPNTCDEFGDTMLIIASENGHSDIVHLLLHAKADPNIPELTTGETALYAASANGHANIVDILLRLGAEPNLKSTSKGETPLHVAATFNHVEVVKALLKSQLVDVNAPLSELQSTALHVAAIEGFNEIVMLLLANNADPNVCDHNGATAIIHACENGHSEIVKLLLQANADPNIAETTIGENALYVASAHGYASIVDLLLKSGADPNFTTSEGATPLHAAADGNHIEVVKAILNSELVDVNVQDSELKSTALHLAAEEGFSEIVALLLASNTDPNICDRNGRTAIMDASANGHSGIVEDLLEAGADPNIAEGTVGGTAIYAASANGHANIVSILVRSGADPNIKTTNQGATPLHVGAVCNRIEVVKALLDSGLVDINAQDSEFHSTALFLAEEGGFSEIVALLLAANDDPNMVIMDQEQSCMDL